MHEIPINYYIVVAIFLSEETSGSAEKNILS